MTVYKFKTFAAAEKSLWSFKVDSTYFKKLTAFFKLATQLSPLNFPKGIFKYLTLEEANKAKNEWILKNAIKNKRNKK